MKTIRDIKKIILASGSPRRKELLSQMGIEFSVIPSNVEEKVTRKIPWEVVMELSTLKARDIMYKVALDSIGDSKNSNEESGVLVIGADTIVAVDDTILGKPKDEDDARHMIKMIQGRSHSVYTGVSLVYIQEGIAQTRNFVECTKVFVVPMTDEQIDSYLSNPEYKDKAGSYAIQGLFAEYISKIEGDYNNVVGLPVGRIFRECNF